MSVERDEYVTTFKALPIFSTMRVNLAMAEAFLRRSKLEPADYEGGDLGFLWVEPGEAQLDVHYRSVTMIVVALVQQALENYRELKRQKLALEYQQLEDFIKDLDNAGEFTNGMRSIRNNVFHVNNIRDWRSDTLKSFDEVCRQRGGVPVVMKELHDLLYDFTEKVFVGELRIWPDSLHLDFESLDEDLLLNVGAPADSGTQ